MSAFMLIQYMDSHASSHVFSIPIWLKCSCFSALSCSASVIVNISLLFIAVPSVIVITSLEDQYGCRPFSTSAVTDGQPGSTSFFYSISMCLSSGIVILISSALMPFMSVHDYMVLKVMHMSGIFFVLCLDRQSVMNNWLRVVMYF